MNGFRSTQNFHQLSFKFTNTMKEIVMNTYTFCTDNLIIHERYLTQETWKRGFFWLNVCLVIFDSLFVEYCQKRFLSTAMDSLYTQTTKINYASRRRFRKRGFFRKQTVKITFFGILACIIAQYTWLKLTIYGIFFLFLNIKKELEIYSFGQFTTTAVHAFSLVESV